MYTAELNVSKTKDNFLVFKMEDTKIEASRLQINYFNFLFREIMN